MSRRDPRGDPTRPGDKTDSKRRFRRRRVTALLVVAVAAAVGIGLATRSAPSDAPAAHDPLAHRTYAVGEVTCTFVDRTRSTKDYVTDAITPDRVLRTEIRYPTFNAATDPAPASGRPFPTIVFAHGYALSPDSYVALLDEWVRAGLVVVAPIFPDTNSAAVSAIGGSGANEADDANQPADITFVTRKVIADSRHRSASCPRLYDLVRPGELGLAGQSDGGETVAMLAYDSRFDAHAGITLRGVAVMSGEEWYYPPTAKDPYLDHPSAPPLLVTQSETDTCNPPQDSAKLYDDDANPDKWFLRIFDATHLGPYDGGAPSAFAAVARTTTRFFEIEVARDAPGAKLRTVGDSAPDVARISTGPTAPTMPSLTQTSASCYKS